MVSATGAAAAAAAAAKAAAMCGAVTAAAAGMVAAPAMASSSARRVRHAFFMARLRHVLHWPHRSSLRMMPYLLERRRLMCGSPPIASARLGVCGSGTGLRNAGFFAGAAGSGAQGSVVPPTSDFGGGPGAAAAGHGNGGGLCPEKEAAVAPRAAAAAVAAATGGRCNGTTRVAATAAAAANAFAAAFLEALAPGLVGCFGGAHSQQGSSAGMPAMGHTMPLWHVCHQILQA